MADFLIGICIACAAGLIVFVTAAIIVAIGIIGVHVVERIIRNG